MICNARQDKQAQPQVFNSNNPTDIPPSHTPPRHPPYQPFSSITPTTLNHLPSPPITPSNMATLPSESALKTAVNQILRTNDLEKITLRIVMSMLSTQFTLSTEDLAPRKKFVRQTINDYLESTYEQAETAPPPPASSKKRKPSSSAPQPDKPPKPVRLTGLERAVVLAEPLANFLGDVVIPRSQIPKRISDYAKQHQLQDPTDRRKINCDDALNAALNVNNFTFFSLAKIVSGLVYKPDECDAELQQLAKTCEDNYLQEKIRKRAEDEANGVVKEPKGKGKTKKQKVQTPDVTRTRKPSGLLKPMQLSDALVAVCGETQLPRSEVLKKVWVYIKENHLKDPNDSKRILCDDKLQAVFDGNISVSHMGINKFLSAHMTKID